MARRAFLRGSVEQALTLFAAVGMLGGRSGAAVSLPVRFVSALRARGDEREYPIPATDGADIDRNEAVIIARWEGRVYAFSLACPHQNTALRWNGEEHRFQCPKHHSQYRPDGGFIEGRATRGMDRFAIRRDGERVVVDLDKLFQQDTDAAAWNSAVITL